MRAGRWVSSCGRGAIALATGAVMAAGLAGSAQAADRAYELVTPAGSNPRVLTGGGEATPDGNVVCFNSESALPGVPSNGIVTADDGYCSWRGPSGWETTWVTGPAVVEHRGIQGAQVYWISPDGARAVFASDAGIYPDYPGDAGTLTPGTTSTFMWEGGGPPGWLTPTPVASPDDQPGVGEPGYMVKRHPVAASEDLTHGVFRSALPLLPQDTNSANDVYEWTPDGIRLVSRDLDGNAVGGQLPFGVAAGQQLGQPGTMSRDGSRIFFHHSGALAGGAPDGVQSVFMRAGEDLKLVSPRRGPGPAADVHFAGASDDGEIVYLRTAEQLTDDARGGGDALYRYSVATDELSLAATTTDGVTFLDVSGDGSTVLYQSGPAFFDQELFVTRGGVATSLGIVPMLDTFDAFGLVGSPRTDNQALRMSRDGSTVVFASTGSFAGTPPGRTQVYRWTPAGGVEHVSAKPDGSAPTADATIGNYTALNPTLPRGETNTHLLRNHPSLGRVLANDGRIFFETPDPLVEGDGNGVIDVYEWDEGTVRLVTPGTQKVNAFYHDSSADGETVFFTTKARIIPELDRNVASDLYAARVGGGFPLPPPTSQCDGDSCQGPGTGPPTTPRAGSDRFQGQGNQRATALRRIQHSVPRLTGKQRRVLARRGRTVLSVRTKTAGRVRVAVTARIAGNRVTVSRASRTARGAGTVRVPLKLSKRAREVLRAKRSLRMVIHVSHSKSRRSVRQVVVLGA